MENLVSLGLRLPRIPRRIGTSHGKLSKFGSEAAKNTPLLPGLELLMEDFISLGPRLPRIPQRIGTSHGRLSKFGSEAAKNTPPGLELLMEDLESSGLRLPRILFPPPHENFSTYVQGAGV